MRRLIPECSCAGQLRDFVQNFPRLQAGERKLLVEALIERVEIGKKRVVALLRPPLTFGYFSPSLAPKEEKRNIPELIIYIGYDLAAYYGEGAHGATRVGTGLSGREYSLQSPKHNAQTLRASAMLLGLPAPSLQTAGAVCATAQAL